MTVVKICGITELEQACWALEAGAELLGFVLAPSRRQLPVQAAAEILLQCRGRFPPRQRPWQAVGVFANQPLPFVRRAAVDARLDCLQLSGQEPPEYCRQLSMPLFKAIHLPAIAPAGPRCECTVPEVTYVGRGALPRRPTLGQRGRGGAQGAALRRGTEERPTQWSIPLSAAYLEEARREYGATRLLLDSGGAGRWGGTGTAFSWDVVGEAARDCLVAGGLNPANVAAAVASMRPWGVDVSSGVERDGKKDPELIRSFVHQAKGGNDHDHVG